MSRAKPVSDLELPEWSVLGDRLRSVRKERGLSLADVSARTGISASFLSLLEQGRSDVTLGRLMLLVQLYGLSIAQLLGDEDDDRVVVGTGDARYLFSVVKGMDVFLLAPDTRRPFVPMLGVYQPGAEMKEFSSHAGDEYLYVLAGGIRLEIDGREPYTLAAGDSAFFSSQRPHRLSTLGDEEARVLTVTSEQVPSAG